MAISVMTMASPLPGDAFLGVPCSHCNEMVLVAPGIPGRGENFGPDPNATEDEFQRVCVRGHLTSFRLDDLRWFQWRPHLNS
jgi:hypothetical protein